MPINKTTFEHIWKHILARINKHNYSTDSHEDIRNQIGNKLDSSAISEWAKAPTKPTYTAEEVGAITEEATPNTIGLMSAADKTKLDVTNIAYGICDTAAATAEKVVTISGNTNWELTAGSIIVVAFKNTNTAQNPTLNVNGAGAKNIYYTGSQITTKNLNLVGYANRMLRYVYDGTQYQYLGWNVDDNNRVQQNTAITTAGEYPVILGYNTATASVTHTVNKTSTLTYNPSTQILTAPTFKGNLDGTATKATQDASGNDIASTYALKTEVPDAYTKTEVDDILSNFQGGGTTVTYGVEDLVAGETELAEGEVYFVYE